MTTFTYLEPNASNTSTKVLNRNGATRLKFTRNNSPIIYTNYPEHIGKDGKSLGLAEYNYCTNKQTVSAGEAQIYFSHINETNKTLKCRVRIKNLSSSTATVQRTNCGFSANWLDAGMTLRDFYSGKNSGTVTVAGNGYAWLTPEYSAPHGQAFSGLIRINTNRNIQIILYLYFNASSIDGAEVVFPYSSAYSGDLQVYSGIGKGFFLTANHNTIATNQMPYRYVTNENGANDSEMTPIDIVGTSLQANESAAYPLNNLGNWCTQYHHKITLKNSSSSKTTVYGYICSNPSGNAIAVAKGSTIKSRLLEDLHMWKWCKVELDGYDSYSFDFQTFLASYCNSPIFHEWSTTNYI